MTMSLRRHDKSIMNNTVRRSICLQASAEDRNGAGVTCCGRLFQIRTAATGKARSL